MSSTFPRHAHDGNGRFLLDLARALPRRITLLVPDDPEATGPCPLEQAERILFSNHGLFHGAGALANLRAGRCTRTGAVTSLASMLGRALACSSSARVIWTHWAVPAGVVGAVCRRIHRIPHVLSLHGGDLWWLEQHRLGPTVARLLARGCDAILAPTELLARRFERLSGRRPGVLGTGVPDLAPPGGEPTPNTVRPALRGPARVGSLCRLAPGKGLARLVGSASALDAELQLAGEGPLTDSLRCLARKHGNVRLMGALVERRKRDWLSSLTAFVAPYGRTPWGQPEGLPVSVLEALSTGLPVVAHPDSCPGGPLRHGHNALLVPAGADAPLTAAINRLVHDGPLRARLSAGARESVRPYLLASVAPRWTEILTDPHRSELC